MKKIIQQEKYEYRCDTCGIDLLKKIHGIPVELSFSYGHELDGEEYHFCSNRCLLKFIIAEENKNNPRTNIEFGKEK
jgi:YHS domain-containing protein